MNLIGGVVVCTIESSVSFSVSRVSRLLSHLIYSTVSSIHRSVSLQSPSRTFRSKYNPGPLLFILHSLTCEGTMLMIRTLWSSSVLSNSENREPEPSVQAENGSVPVQGVKRTIQMDLFFSFTRKILQVHLRSSRTDLNLLVLSNAPSGVLLAYVDECCRGT